MAPARQAVCTMLGPGQRRLADPAAWLRLEERLGRSLPADYKRIVDTYAHAAMNTAGPRLALTPQAWSAFVPYASEG
ncbi:SMI1/KNR4 family protein [Streptomyces sp. NL15-2K]|uniref:SMI1/KNR4 family protein n=1 Tax=Streptomyces sp. NL15-2K TaxID=376149 RepID=UPI000F5740F0|nr:MULTISPECIES: SMI1/KNR4 family protein [Actinomycetes]WKX11834.1 SMI1/KNR4 family protein [Kutzneria buriramensis]GCB46680.1 hypothetical protein SNL152K_3978 [Streptomyces sp. NL15-2K]